MSETVAAALDATDEFKNEILYSHHSSITSLKFSPDGQFLASASADRTVQVVSYASRASRPLIGHTKGINDIEWFHYGGGQPMIISSSDDYCLKVWDVQKGTAVRSYEDLDIVYSLCMHTSHNIVFGGTTAELLKYWDFRLRDPCIAVIHVHNDIVSSLTCSPNGRELCTSSFDGTVRMWDIGSGRCVKTMQSPDETPISKIQYCSTGEEDALLVSCLNSTHEIWDNTGHQANVTKGRDRNLAVPALQTYTGHLNQRYSVGAVIPRWANGTFPNILISGSEDSQMVIWDRESAKLVARIRVCGSDDTGLGSSAVTGVECHPTLPGIIATAGGGASADVKLWEIPL